MNPLNLQNSQGTNISFLNWWNFHASPFVKLNPEDLSLSEAYLYEYLASLELRPWTGESRMFYTLLDKFMKRHFELSDVVISVWQKRSGVSYMWWQKDASYDANIYCLVLQRPFQFGARTTLYLFRKKQTMQKLAWIITSVPDFKKTNDAEACVNHNSKKKIF
jgi:hypothetical protein